jgi:predicted ATPase
MIKTPDQRLRVFVSSTLGELADERKAAAEAIGNMRLAPVLFELGARPHPPKDLYRAYLAQSHIFVGIYWERYGWVAPDMEMSGLEDEYRLAGSMPKLIYVKRPAPRQEPRLKELLETIKGDDHVSYKPFEDADELKTLIQDDLALLLTESFESGRPGAGTAPTRESRHNLPSHPTPFVGREAEAAALQRLLEEPDVRLLTITGPGGIGKTRLGLEVAARCADSFPDGVRLVKLASVTDPRLILPEIARVLGTPDRADGLSVAAVREHIGDREMLLVLDNFEHLVIAAPVVGELLAGSPRLKVMVTSRSVLRLRGEYEYPTPTMQIPEPRSCRLEEVLQWESVRLFDERARAANPRFELTAENCDAVLEICRRLDGLPLALELAAARTKLLTPEAMLKRMDNRLQLLTGGSRDAPLRQRTLRDGLDWDYELLSAEEQMLFRGLAVFSGGFTLDSAEAVLNGSDQVWLDVFNGIDSLAGKSLIRRESLDSDDLRFGTLKIIREYALEKLTESEELEEFQRRHAEYFTGFAERCASEIDGPVQSEWLVRLESEHGNLRSALRWAHRHEPVLFTRLCAALGAFWEYRSYLTEGRYWLEVAIETRDGVPDELRAGVLNYAGIMARAQGDYDRGRARSEEAVSLWRSLGNQERLANALKNLGNIYLDTGDLERAAELYQESADLYRAAADRHGAAATLNNLGVLARMRGDWATAMTFYEEALTLFTEASDLQGRGRVLMNLGEARYEAGDLHAAARFCKDSLELFRDTGSKWAIADVLEILAAVASAMGDAEEAAKLFGAAEALRESLKTPLPPAEKETYEMRVLETRRKLDGSAFAVAWSWGRAMTLEEALDHALTSEPLLR